ncbi:hypothetical protein RYX36_010049 [Vicia faba]
MVSVVIVGHLGELRLAGATLANSWFGVTGIAVTMFSFQLSQQLLKLVLHMDFSIEQCYVGHGVWIQLFSSSPTIKKEFASIAPLLAISILLDSIQGVLSGVVRACGLQRLAVYVNLASFYHFGLPISCLLGFKTNLKFKIVNNEELCSTYTLKNFVPFIPLL